MPELSCQNPLRIHHLNVGQGDSTLIVGPSGRTVLIDSGPPAAGKVLFDYFERLNIPKINVLVATHQDNDHIGGWARSDKLKGKFCPDRFYHGDIATTGNPTKVLQKLLRFFRMPFEFAPEIAAETRPTCQANVFNLKGVAALEQHFRRPVDLGDNARLRFVAANGYVVGHEGRVDKVNTANERSVAAYLEYGGFDYFIGGDLIGRPYAAENAAVEGAVGRFLQTIADSPAGDPVDLLHVGHHGGNNASEESFLASIKAETGVISAGDNNGYCHPHPETLARLRAAGLRKVYLTNGGTVDPSYPPEECKEVPLPQPDPSLAILHGAVVVYACPAEYAVCNEDGTRCDTLPTD